MLRLNDVKTEVIVIRPRSVAQHRLPYIIRPTIGNAQIESTDAARNLGVEFDSLMILELHVAYSCCVTTYTAMVMRDGISVNSVPGSLFTKALVIGQLDRCNSLLVDLPDTLLHRLQRALNASSRMILGSPGQVRACHAGAEGASLVAYQKPHPVQSTVTHISVCIIWALSTCVTCSTAT